MIKLILIASFCIGVAGCGNPENKFVRKKDTIDSSVRMYRVADAPTLVRAFKNSGNWDSVYLYSDGHLVIIQQPPQTRYFLVSYSCLTKDESKTITGFRIFSSSNGFFSIRQFDSLCFADFPNARNCYQQIIITYLYEFKSQQDFDDFQVNAKWQKLPKNKITCK